MYVFNPVFKAGTVSLIRKSGGNNFQIYGTAQRKPRDVVDCLAQADEEDVDLWISSHELAAGGSTSQQDNEIDHNLTLCT